ncbi:uncharacterized protein B0I36DRAFT_319745 [Microdochium trichocladiopsis]|uniref:Uncharacterized protein n=1 Tax=Microdochium trichocladiopsis TaxID=1682393 RepID=A0A9P8YA65_9PEZI|nr:uncharacterized protein B0I36DRAFT_319745 [Microdochium trichocladiopsis]KAH7032624.1 hypothetical protein B0I36DRAFT_319745 [Microdochium trichocladiopsis]
MWGRANGQGPVYYWSVKEQGKGEPTTVWRFTHRRGSDAQQEVRYGDNPRDFWEGDWDEDREGDTAEATPFSRNFIMHDKGIWSGWNCRYNQSNNVPEGATEFTDEARKELVDLGLWEEYETKVRVPYSLPSH